MANSLGTKTLRDKYRSAALQTILRKALVAEKICEVDRSDSYTIQNPYINGMSTTVQALTGTYAPATLTTVNDTLTVSDEVVVATHIYGFEIMVSKP